MIFTFNYTDRESKVWKSQRVNPALDVVQIELPPQPEGGLPRLTIDINSDAVIIRDNGGQVAMFEFDVLLIDRGQSDEQ